MVLADEDIGKDTAVADSVTVIIRHSLKCVNRCNFESIWRLLAFPRNNASEASRLPGRHTPLAARIVANTEEADFPIAPGLHCCPLDHVHKAIAGGRAHGVKLPRAVSRPALIGSNHDIVVRCPESRIRSLPCGML